MAITSKSVSFNGDVRYLRFEYPWTSDSSGDVSLEALIPFGAKIKSFQTIPGANGDLATNLPTNAYDVTLLDSFGEDIMASNTLNRSGTVAETYYALTDIVLSGDLTLVVANAGDTKEGLCIAIYELS